jgi:hypothetical protein
MIVERIAAMFQLAPPDTLSYMLLGFGVIFLGLGILILSLIIRFRNLRRDADILEEIEASKEN